MNRPLSALLRSFLYGDSHTTLTGAPQFPSSLVLLSEQDETAATINDFVVIHSDPRTCVYCICADPERNINVLAIAKDPDRRRPALKSVEPEEVPIVRVTEQPSRGNSRFLWLALTAVTREHCICLFSVLPGIKGGGTKEVCRARPRRKRELREPGKCRDCNYRRKHSCTRPFAAVLCSARNRSKTYQRGTPKQCIG